jgi:hypothetical protein
MNFEEQRAADLAYTRCVATELRLRFLIARIALVMRRAGA